MSNIKKLVNQTLWYGLPTILTRFIGFTLNIIVIRLYPPSVTNDNQLLYAVIPLLMVIFTYGLETSYFRFSLTVDKKKLFNTSFTSILFTSLFFCLVVFLFSQFFANLIGIYNQATMVKWLAFLLLFDTLSAMPFAKLRQQERPRKFALVKMLTVVIQFVLILIVYKWWIPNIKSNPTFFLSQFYNGNDMLYFVIINVFTSFLSFIFLYKEWKDYTFSFDKILMRNILKYSLPLVLIGVLGMSNETLGRIIFNKLLHLPEDQINRMSGILQTVFKMAILINVFTQMFRIAAEPFFFSKSKDADAKNTYAQSMIMYIILSSYAFISVVFFKEILIKFVAAKFQHEYAEALYIVPILCASLVLSGIYYNLTVWYKLTDNNIKGALIAAVGLMVNVFLSIILVPKLSYGGVAIASLVSYIVLIIISYTWGQKYYHINYNLPKIFAHIIFISLMYLILNFIQGKTDNLILKTFIGFFAFVFYTLFVFFTEKNLVRKIPFLNK